MAEKESTSSSSPESVAQPSNAEIKARIIEINALVDHAKQSTQQAEEISKRAADAEAAINELLVKIRESQAKADNEALRANQAKLMVEDHSNNVAKLKGNIEADSAAISSKKTEIENLAQTFVNLRGSCESDATTIANTRKTVELASTAITEISGKVAAVQANIDETKKSIDTTSQNIREETKNIEAKSSEISSAKASSDSLLATMQKTFATTNELHEKAKTAHESIESLRDDAKSTADSMNELAGKAREVEQRVLAYEKNLAKLETDFAAIRAKVEGLLPGATSAGLASSFCSQKDRFRWPQMAWILTFISCIVVLLIGSWSLWTAPDQTWDAIWRHLVQRLPCVIPLVWLGVYSGRQFMLSLRMEEEYAFKEAISTAFEGYKREMGDIPENVQGRDVPINVLCSYVLATLARRPGLIYEGKQQDITPFTPAVDAVEKLIPVAVDAVAKNIKNAVPIPPGNGN